MALEGEEVLEGELVVLSLEDQEERVDQFLAVLVGLVVLEVKMEKVEGFQKVLVLLGLAYLALWVEGLLEEL